jgi:OmpA-OmpF porin, OOP family
VTRNSFSGSRSTKCFTFFLAGLGFVAVGGSQSAWAADSLTQPGGNVAEPPAEGAFNADRLSPAPGPRNFIATRTARSDGDKTYSIAGLVSYSNEPLTVLLDDAVCQQAADCKTHVIQNLATLNLMGSFTPVAWLQFGLRIPLIFSQGQGIRADGKAAALDGKGIEAWGLSDPELEAKVRFFGDAKAPFAAGVAVFGTAPLGEVTAKGAYVGSGSVTAGGRLIGDGQVGPFSYGVNLGYRYQKPAKMVSKVGSEALFSVGAGFVPSPVFKVMGELFGSTQFSGDVGTTAAEVAVAAQFTPLSSPIAITLGGGPGLAQGAIGVPMFRVFAGVAFTHEKNDLDGDGISDAADQCPTDLEDLDGVDDADGCPDVDNDGDALPDVQDRCKSEAENVNGFQDEDGCPDVKDSDADGVPDKDDKCVDEKEDTDGFEDTDGCPDNDNDADGIPDTSDECVDQAEDMNGLEDSDGCPDLE